MRSRTERSVWAIAAVGLLAAAAAAWWTRDSWLPQAEPWARQAWRKATRPGPESLPPDKQGSRPARAGASEPAVAVQPRKCVQPDGRVTYTDQPCAQGSRELAVEGALTSLPTPAR